eukprot:31102-Pelagococcus_subviridis.AAC.6
MDGNSRRGELTPSPSFASARSRTPGSSPKTCIDGLALEALPRAIARRGLRPLFPSLLGKSKLRRRQ